MFLSDEFKDMYDKREEIFKELLNSPIPLILIGAHGVAALAREHFERNNIKIEAQCVDADYVKYCPGFISLEEALNKYESFNICMGVINPHVVTNYLEILKDSRVNKIYFLDFNEIVVDRGVLNSDFVLKNKEMLEETYNMLQDELSKQSFISFIKTRISGDTSYILPHTLMKDINGVQYFVKDLIDLSEKECFIDCGAFNGDTIRDLINTSGSAEHRIFAFEADSQNYKILTSYIEKSEAMNITAIAKGVWKEKDVLYFTNEGAANSTFNNSGSLKVEVDSIDNVLGDEPISFIKMDIEGAEYEALLGAEMTIKKNKPKLAISIYHRNEHLFKIPSLIKEFCSDYTFNVRLHTYCSCDLILYAVPNK